MSSTRRSVIEGRLECPICYEGFSSTREGGAAQALFCGHMICLWCVRRIQAGQGPHADPLEVRCPKCRAPTGFGTNFHVMEMADALAKTSSVCKEHDGEYLVYCLECEQSLCLLCLRHSHKAHAWVELKAAVEEKSSLLRRTQRVVRERVDLLQSLITQQEQKLDETHARLSQTITDSRDRVIAAAKRQADILLGKLAGFTANAKGNLRGSCSFKAQASLHRQMLDGMEAFDNDDPVSALAQCARVLAKAKAVERKTAGLQEPNALSAEIVFDLSEVEILEQLARWRCSYKTIDSIEEEKSAQLGWFWDGQRTSPGVSLVLDDHGPLTRKARRGKDARRWLSVMSNVPFTESRSAFSIELDEMGGGVVVGVSAALPPPGTYAGGADLGYGYSSNEHLYHDGSKSSRGTAFNKGDVIRVQLDILANTLTFFKNGRAQGKVFHKVDFSAPLYACVSMVSKDTQVSLLL